MVEFMSKHLPMKKEQNCLMKARVDGTTHPEKRMLGYESTDPLRSDEELDAVTCFGKLADSWLEDKKLYVKNSTYARYRYLLEKHIGPYFAHRDISHIEDGQLENMLYEKYTGATGKKLSEKTIQDILSVFRSIVNYAEERECIPAGRLKMRMPNYITKRKEKKAEVMPTRDRLILEEHLLKHRYGYREFGILLAMYTGLRIGELCALRWKDIDLENKILYVNHTLLRLHDYSDGAGDRKTRVVLDTPKTRSSCREIPLSSFLAEHLAAMHLCGYDDDDYLLSAAKTPEEPRSYLYFYKRQLELCGLPEYNFHILRHTFATRCVEEGFDIKSLSEILGHSNVKITMDRYVHPSLEAKRRQMELLTVGL